MPQRNIHRNIVHHNGRKANGLQAIGFALRRRDMPEVAPILGLILLITNGGAG